MTTRRSVVGGLAAGLLAPRALAATGDRLFAGTPFADNRIARSFARVDLALPDVTVLTRTGSRRLPQLAGTPRLLTLWAEWCVPCLLEARDLAAAKPRLAGGRFDIVSVLTGSSAKLDHAGAVQRLERAGASGLTVLVEPDGGHAISDALGVMPPASAMPAPATLPPGARVTRLAGLPCTLLVDRHGRVRGRATGMLAAAPPPIGGGQGTAHVMSAAEKAAMLTDGEKTAWSTPDGERFLQALRGGLLDRL